MDIRVAGVVGKNIVMGVIQLNSVSAPVESIVRYNVVIGFMEIYAALFIRREFIVQDGIEMRLRQKNSIIAIGNGVIAEKTI